MIFKTESKTVSIHKTEIRERSSKYFVLFILIKIIDFNFYASYSNGLEEIGFDRCLYYFLRSGFHVEYF